jgi:hypothetical protein
LIRPGNPRCSGHATVKFARVCKGLAVVVSTAGTRPWGPGAASTRHVVNVHAPSDGRASIIGSPYPPAASVGSSWMNQIETWLGIITRQAIRRDTFSSVNALVARIRAYVEHWNTEAKPFTWTATAEEILAKVRLVQTNVQKLVANNSK